MRPCKKLQATVCNKIWRKLEAPAIVAKAAPEHVKRTDVLVTWAGLVPCLQLLQGKSCAVRRSSPKGSAEWRLPVVTDSGVSHNLCLLLRLLNRFKRVLDYAAVTFERCICKV